MDWEKMEVSVRKSKCSGREALRVESCGISPCRFLSHLRTTWVCNHDLETGELYSIIV